MMLTEKLKNNKVTVMGKIVSGLTFDHEVLGEGFYLTRMEIERLSGNADILPVLISERLLDVEKDYTGCVMEVSGQFRSFNQHDGNRSRLILQVFALEARVLDGEADPFRSNRISLDGRICKAPVYRKTPSGREIADILLAVNRDYGRSDYIPCIAWERNAGYASRMHAGMRLKLQGRIQSRDYLKRLSETETEQRTAYEVSISTFEIVQ